MALYTASAVGAPHRRDGSGSWPTPRAQDNDQGPVIRQLIRGNGQLRTAQGRGMTLHTAAKMIGELHGRARRTTARGAERRTWEGGQSIAMADADGNNGQRRRGALQMGWGGVAREIANDGDAGRTQWRVEPDVCGISDGISARLHGDMNASERVDTENNSQDASEIRLRNVWFKIAARSTSQGPRPDEQLAKQLADALPDLSHALALAGRQDALAAASRFLHRMRQACETLGVVRDTSQPIIEAWQSLSQEEADRAFLAACGRANWRSGEWLGVGRVAHKVPNRVERLRALGNAVIPQIPELIGRAIMQKPLGNGH